MHIVHLALGGCLRAPPVAYGLTADTGGHIAYVLGASASQAASGDTIKVTIVTRLFDDSQLGTIHKQQTESVGSGVTIVRLPSRDDWYVEKEALPAQLPSFQTRFIDWLGGMSERPSVIHAHFSEAVAVAKVARERFGIPLIYTPHALGRDKAGVCGRSAATATRIEAERHAIEVADAIVVSTADEGFSQVTAYGVACSERVHVIAPGAPSGTSGRHRLSTKTFANPGRPMMLAIARPNRKKNLIGIIDAYANSRLPEVANLMILAGQQTAASPSDEERTTLSDLRRIVRNSDLGDRVVMPPRHTRADVWASYRLAARSGGLFVSPALHEPFGLTLLEAAAVGLPVVASANGGGAEIVAQIGHGLTVDPYDRQAIADACLRILSEPGLRRQFCSRAAGYATCFSWESYGRQTIALYAKLAREAAMRTNAVAA